MSLITMKKSIAVLLLSATATVAVAQNAFNDAEKAVEYRQKALSVMQNNFAVMGDMVKGDTDYDADIFTARAQDFARLSHIPWAAFSVEGAMPGDDTDALPAIWDNWDDFQDRADSFSASAEKLYEVSQDGSLDSIRPVFMETAKSCKGCHDQYRD